MPMTMEAAAVAEGAAKTAARNFDLRKVAVLGAGTMGARIAAQVVNAGLPVVLLDIAAPHGDDKYAVVNAAFDALKKSKPAAFAEPGLASRVTIGTFDEDMAKLKDCDWVIEAVAENLEIKRALLAKVLPHLKANAILTTNTSGLPVAKIAAELPEDVRRRWFGTHFFNPPRYMRLLEIIPTPDSDPEAVEAVSEFGEQRLGKMIVPAKDVQNFIANRVGTFSMLNMFRVMKEQGLSIEEVDSLTGTPMGWPKTGTFRLTDMVGIDVLWHVAKNASTGISDERGDVTLPPVVDEMVKRKWLGDKTRQGFYKKEKGADGKENRFVLDLETLEYKPSNRPKIAELEMVKANDSLPARIKALLAPGPDGGKVAKFYWTVLPELWTYAANRIGEVSDGIVEIDRAMKGGFNWELGPFEMWDVAGVRDSVETMRAHGMPVAASVETLLAHGESWYRNGGTEYFDVASASYKPVDKPAALSNLADFKRSNGVVAGNSSISLVDLGDGIACFEFHSKMNSLGEEIVRFLHKSFQPDSDAVKNFRGFVIANDAANFSVGANLMALMLMIQDEEWDEIAFGVKSFQAMTQLIKFCPRPVVAAPSGMCLGGGTEISLHAALRQPHLELYAGLVETGVGLIPGGGGCKEMTLRALDSVQLVSKDTRGESVEVHDALRGIFETIAMAKVSTSAMEARGLGFLDKSDAITMNRDRLITDAKAQAMRLAEAGYVPPVPRVDVPAPGVSVEASLKLGAYMMKEAGFISDHDLKIAQHLAHVLCGGGVNAGTLISEARLIEVEREAFLSLCGERKTVERIGFTLKTGKPLRN
jgi:3-hydroxyacyl-CoA dehydrogenase